MRKMTAVASCLCIFMVAIIAGCSSLAKGAPKEVELKQLSSGAKSFVDQIKDKSGLYLYSPAGEQTYLIVNHLVAGQDEEAKYLESLKTELKDHLLRLDVNELGTTEYSDKRLGQIRFFELGNSSRDYNAIQVYKNGVVSKFDSIGG
ncbi:hypothetical protein R70723_28955 [Paenibacillus sp. FSL R7-0273]|uniref:hypothetical protein n=1 Tax=Paenibacillus sp. FSL R7-0273 TaxID=1536772 RepID=UPI0004F8FDB6|nr:hypothetical protein [Paenibacillus sp. FSL R7-0273]AIQ49463.1 hypothetical protein R70723_28955 [Paenibacillus sp. FSL R7-0273]OMF89664.1 hypothetical protein BK144_19070 [Paenibacillus sp. FSL R7-0273]